MTENKYQENIPECCKHKTVKQHFDIMLLCWSIISGRVNKDNCDGCKTCSENRLNPVLQPHNLKDGWEDYKIIDEGYGV